jgi:hypothetical protein
MYKLIIHGKNGNYEFGRETFEEACASKERASKKIAFVGMKMEVIVSE